MLKDSLTSELLCVQPGISGCFPKTPFKLSVLLLKKLYLEISSAYVMSTQSHLSGEQDLEE